MESRAKLLGHPIHQMLIVLPLGLLPGSLAFDIATLATGNPQWSVSAFWLISAGIVCGLVAAMFGLIDFLAIPKGTRARSIGALHGIINVTVVTLFLVSWFIRRPDPGNPGWAALSLSGGALVLALIAGWLGGELVNRLGVGVDPGAHLNAPSSLSGQPVGQSRTGT
jgi:uncharacterized membrane protein